MRLKSLPKTYWDYSLYNPELYGYGDVDVFVSANSGERVICIFRKKDLHKYDDDNCTDITFAILCNDCGIESNITELQWLTAGQIVPVQFIGNDTPIIPHEWIEYQINQHYI